MSVSHRIRKLIRKTQHLCRRTKKFRATKIQSLTHSSPATASLSTWSTSKISQVSLSLWDNLSLNNRMMPPPKIRKKLTIILIIIPGQRATITKIPDLETETQEVEMAPDLVIWTTTHQLERTKVWTSASSTRWLRTTSLKTLNKLLIKHLKFQTKQIFRTNRLSWSNLNLMRINWSTLWGSSQTTKLLNRPLPCNKKIQQWEWGTTGRHPALVTAKNKIVKLRLRTMFHKLKLSKCVINLIKWHRTLYRQ